MDLIFEDVKKRKVIGKKDIEFSLTTSGLYLIEITAGARSEKQLQTTDDEDLRVEIDDRKFLQLQNPQRYFDNPASFSGGQLHGLKKTVFFILPLDPGQHLLSLIPDNAADLQGVKIFLISAEQSVEKVELPGNIQPEDGDRRPWITIALTSISLATFSLTVTLKRRFIDSDDMKVIIDGVVQRNYRNILHKLWYFIASLGGEEQSSSFTVNFLPGLHYIELWADRMPVLNDLTLNGLKTQLGEESIESKIQKTAKKYDLDPELIIKVAKKESGLDPMATSPVGAKGIFQLMDITIKQIANLGFEINNPYDVDQNITGGIIYFQWLYKMYKSDSEQLEKTLAAWNWGQNNFPKEGPLDYELMPDETKNFIRSILDK